MLQNARITTFTVSELLRENQQRRGRWGWVKLPCCNLLFATLFFQLKFKTPFTDSKECRIWFFRCRSRFLVSNHILLWFKHSIYISRDTNILLFLRFFQEVYTIEQKINRVREKRNYFPKIVNNLGWIIAF